MNPQGTPRAGPGSTTTAAEPDRKLPEFVASVHPQVLLIVLAAPEHLRLYDRAHGLINHRLFASHKLQRDAPRVAEHGEDVAAGHGMDVRDDGGAGGGESFDVGFEIF